MVRRKSALKPQSHLRPRRLVIVVGQDNTRPVRLLALLGDAVKRHAWAFGSFVHDDLELKAACLHSAQDQRGTASEANEGRSHTFLPKCRKNAISWSLLNDLSSPSKG